MFLMLFQNLTYQLKERWRNGPRGLPSNDGFRMTLARNLVRNAG